MTPLKADLICEIIRKSQCNLLHKKGFNETNGTEASEDQVLDWVRHNARGYREHFRGCLEGLSTTELGDILKTLATTGKDLNEILLQAPGFVERS